MGTYGKKENSHFGAPWSGPCAAPQEACSQRDGKGIWGYRMDRRSGAKPGAGKTSHGWRPRSPRRGEQGPPPGPSPRSGPGLPPADPVPRSRSAPPTRSHHRKDLKRGFSAQPPGTWLVPGSSCPGGSCLLSARGLDARLRLHVLLAISPRRPLRGPGPLKGLLALPMDRPFRPGPRGVRPPKAASRRAHPRL